MPEPTRVWRLCRAIYAQSSFSGEGSFRFSGRWNPAGVRMVYTSTSLALASIELFVHLDPTDAPNDLVVTSATLPASLTIEVLTPGDLPDTWRSLDNPALQRMGAEWIRSNRSAALKVPSVVVEGDSNILLNPAHPDFPKIQVDPPTPWHFDQRLFHPRS